jgi:hypothetical protein
MFKRMLGLIAAVLLIWLATLVANYLFHYFRLRAIAVAGDPLATTSWPDPSYFYTFSILAIGLLSFLGFLSLSRELRGVRGAFQDGDVRLAITCSFVTVFLTLLSYYSFASSEQKPTEVGQQFFDSFLSLTVVIIGFYFATTGAVEILKTRKKGDKESQEADRPSSTEADASSAS